MIDNPGPGKTLFQEAIAQCTRLGVPAQAALELTYRCNLRCAHCYVDVREPDELTTAEWKQVIGRLKEAGTMYLLFTGGELMVRPDWLEIAGYARGSGFFIGLITNATLVTPGLARELAALRPSSVATSLHGATAATHDAITGQAGSFKRTVEGIRLLAGEGLAPLVQTLAMKSNLAELHLVGELVAKLGATSKIDLGMAPAKSGGTFPFREEPGFEDLLACRWRPEAFDAAGASCPAICKAGKSMCSVSPGGDVFPCLMFPLKLGNLREESFDKIWRLEPCAELRYLRSIKRADLDACGRCDLAAYCQRCTGIAYGESGRANGPSPSACRQAQVRWRLNRAAEVASC